MANNISNCQRTIVDANLTNPTSISKTFIQRNEKAEFIYDNPAKFTTNSFDDSELSDE